MKKILFVILALAAIGSCAFMFYGDYTDLFAGPVYPPNPNIGKEVIKNITLIDYPEDLEFLFKKNPDAADFVLSYNIEKDKKVEVDISEYKNSKEMPLFIQWDKRWGYMPYAGSVAGTSACGPVCLSMVGYHLTKNEKKFAPDKMINYAIDNGYAVDGSGTLWSLMYEGAEDLGLSVEELPLVEAYIIEAVTEGKPVILIMGPGVFTSTGHFIVLCGYEDGAFIVRDPNSYQRSEKKWKFSEFSAEIDGIWSYSVANA